MRPPHTGQPCEGAHTSFILAWVDGERLDCAPEHISTSSLYFLAYRSALRLFALPLVGPGAHGGRFSEQTYFTGALL